MHQRCPSVRLSVCLSVAKMQKNAIFSKKKLSSYGVYWRPIESRTSAFNEAIIGPIKSKMAEIRHLGSWRQNAKRWFSQLFVVPFTFSHFYCMMLFKAWCAPKAILSASPVTRVDVRFKVISRWHAMQIKLPPQSERRCPSVRLSPVCLQRLLLQAAGVLTSRAALTSWALWDIRCILTL